MLLKRRGLWVFNSNFLKAMLLKTTKKKQKTKNKKKQKTKTNKKKLFKIFFYLIKSF
jgi:hypothetical protein